MSAGKACHIYSMTGFGKSQVERESIQVSVEIKSVNHRFKDIRFKMTSQLSAVELELRNMINENFKRGSFDVFINYKRMDSSSKFDDLDEEKINSYLTKIKSIAIAQGFDLTIKPTEFLRAEFLKEQDDSFSEKLSALVIEAFPAAIESLKESRKVEGKKLVEVINSHRNIFEENYKKVLSLSDTFKESITDRLNKKFEEFAKNLQIDEPRYLQEVIYYLEKMDIHEELNRIAIHLKKFDSIMTGAKEIGREMDFLLQELNRETNTTGSKSTVQEISSHVVEMKVQLEKIREQALNLE